MPGISFWAHGGVLLGGSSFAWVQTMSPYSWHHLHVELAAEPLIKAMPIHFFCMQCTCNAYATYNGSD